MFRNILIVGLAKLLLLKFCNTQTAGITSKSKAISNVFISLVLYIKGLYRDRLIIDTEISLNDEAACQQQNVMLTIPVSAHT